MKQYLLATAAVLLLVIGASSFIGCSSSTDSNDPSVTMTTSVSNRTVSGAATRTNIPLGGGLTCDSVVISRARILISELKLHHDDEDTVGAGTIKVGPFIAEWDSTGEKIVSTVTVPPGTYDKIKFEMHKLDDKSDAALINDPLFGDFLNGGRYTAIIDGMAYVNGTGYAFSFKTSKTDNVEMKFPAAVTFSSGNSYNLAMVFDPTLVFGQSGKSPYDPRDASNQDEIANLIKNAIKALKK